MPLHQKALPPALLRATSQLKSTVLSAKPVLSLATQLLPLLLPQSRLVRLLPKALLLAKMAVALKPLLKNRSLQSTSSKKNPTL